ncbi:MAG TPA: S8 family serine peptidase [Solirubrobacterales bacterium]|nr:S8 family serine peptidase [Solirubrobacterales bacterium]
MANGVDGAGELLGAFAPALRYHPKERFRATRVESMVEAEGIPGAVTELRAGDDGPAIASTDAGSGLPTLSLATLAAAGKKYPGTEAKSHRSHYLAGRLPDDAAFTGTPVAYGRAVGVPDGTVWLQYWLYSYDNPHHLVGTHQGDWELVQLKVDPARSPAQGGLLAATCFQHGDQDGREGEDLTGLLDGDGLLPVLVARGSHASYFDFEYVHFGDELQIEAPAERPQVIEFDEGAEWLKWPGYWGGTRWFDKPRSPRGPMMCRPEWFEPQAQHQAGLYQRARRRKERVPSVMISTSAAPSGGRVALIAQVEEGESTAGLETAVAGLGLEEATVQPLHDGDLPDPGKRQLVVRATLPPAGANPFDLARELEAAGHGAWEVEPDLDSTIFRPSPNGYRICEALGQETNEPLWAIEHIGCPEAWKHSRGGGVKVGHPDTGYVDHPQLQGTIGAGGYDVLENDDDPHDVLTGIPPAQFPGHGTGTASVIASTDAPGIDLLGAAPEAKVLPFRIARSVILLRGGRLLRAIRKAREADCRVISISLGGIFLGSALRRELDAATAEGRIVIAAAGQPVRFVVEPASYAATIGVGGSTIDREPWPMSARGESVDLCAPAAHVPRAVAKTGEVARGDGTSFSTALTAGVAALWFSTHSEELLAGDRAQIVPKFRSLLKQSTAAPAGWDSENYGSGILDAAALLELPLSAAKPEPPPPEVSRGKRIVKWLARLVEEPADDVRGWIDRTFSGDPEQAAERIGTELASLSSEDEEVRVAVKRAAAQGEAGLPAPLRAKASSSLESETQPA